MLLQRPEHVQLTLPCPLPGAERQLVPARRRAAGLEMRGGSSVRMRGWSCTWVNTRAGVHHCCTYKRDREGRLQHAAVLGWGSGHG